MRLAVGLYVAVWIGSGGAARAQQFEVASVKPSRADAVPEGQIRAMDMMAEGVAAGFVPVQGTTLSAHSRTLAQLIAMAFTVKPSAVTGPGWITELRYAAGLRKLHDWQRRGIRSLQGRR